MSTKIPHFLGNRAKYQINTQVFAKKVLHNPNKCIIFAPRKNFYWFARLSCLASDQRSSGRLANQEGLLLYFSFYHKLVGGKPTVMFASPILSELYLKTLFGRDFSQFHNIKHIKHDIIIAFFTFSKASLAVLPK